MVMDDIYRKGKNSGSFFCVRFAVMFYMITFINIISFILFGIDKRKAVKPQRRIPESTLLSFTFLGGTIGAVVGMLIFRHKVSKKSFLMKLAFIILMQAFILYYIRKMIIK